eukprot:906307-Pelagomonas_calceolata.AAC.2
MDQVEKNQLSLHTEGGHQCARVSEAISNTGMIPDQNLSVQRRHCKNWVLIHFEPGSTMRFEVWPGPEQDAPSTLKTTFCTFEMRRKLPGECL